MKTRKIVAFIVSIIILLASNSPVSADIAPPDPAPGSGINPSQETRVRMVAENVLMVVKQTTPDTYGIEVTADFAMRNLGESDEKLQIRFPLENISGLGDMSGGQPEVTNFKASVNKSQVPTKLNEEPYETTGIPLNWAEFDVNFPVQQDVFIRVSYETELQEYQAPSIEYILGTGAGWNQSIGTITITIRFPYAVSQANIFGPLRADTFPENVSMIGKEIRWHWENYEPAIDEVIGVRAVHPKDWQEILNLEYDTGVHPDDIDKIIKLSRAYQVAGSNKGFISSPILANLAEITVQQALALHPQETRLHVELAEIYNKRVFWSQRPDDPTVKKLQDELAVILALDPTNKRGLELENSLKIKLEEEKTSSLSPTPLKKTATSTPTQKPATLTDQPVSTSTIMPEVVNKSDNAGLQIFAGVSLLISGFAIGMLLGRGKRKTI